MILYSLRCAAGHEFEQWFDNMADFDARRAAGALTCPDCGGHDVAKAIMAPRVGKSAAAAAPAPACGAPSCANSACPMAGGFL